MQQKVARLFVRQPPDQRRPLIGRERRKLGRHARCVARACRRLLSAQPGRCENRDQERERQEQPRENLPALILAGDVSDPAGWMPCHPAARTGVSGLAPGHSCDRQSCPRTKALDTAI